MKKNLRHAGKQMTERRPSQEQKIGVDEQAISPIENSEDVTAQEIRLIDKNATTRRNALVELAKK